MKLIDVNINWSAFEYYSALKRLHRHVTDSPQRPLSLTEAAAIAAMEASHFSKFFHNKTGICFKHWEGLRRVRIATSLFDTTDISVTEAAFSSGVNDVTPF